MSKPHFFCRHHNRYFLSYHNKHLNLYLPFLSNGVRMWRLRLLFTRPSKALQARETRQISLSDTAVYRGSADLQPPLLTVSAACCGAVPLCFVVWFGFFFFPLRLFFYVFIHAVWLLPAPRGKVNPDRRQGGRKGPGREGKAPPSTGAAAAEPGRAGPLPLPLHLPPAEPRARPWQDGDNRPGCPRRRRARNPGVPPPGPARSPSGTARHGTAARS